MRALSRLNETAPTARGEQGPTTSGEVFGAKVPGRLNALCLGTRSGHLDSGLGSTHMRTILFIAIVVAAAVLVGWEVYDKGWFSGG